MKIMPTFTEVLMPELQAIGKLQILRRLITKQIHFLAKVECSQYESCLSTLNTTIINNMQEIKQNAQQAYDLDGQEPTDDQPKQVNVAAAEEASKKIKEMCVQLTKALETVGIVNPYNKVYYMTKPLEKMSLFMTIFTLSALQELRFDAKLSSLRKFEDPKEKRKN